jgi:uncharacterized protein (DUF983 family)
MSEPIPKLKTLLWRGWCRKCPRCGQGALYQRWMRLHEHCPVCGLEYVPDQGDLLGPLIFLDRVLFLFPVIVLFYFGLWHPGLFGFVSLGITGLFLLVYTMPHRNGASLAIDYLIRRKDGELAQGASAASAESRPVTDVSHQRPS